MINKYLFKEWINYKYYRVEVSLQIPGINIVIKNKTILYLCHSIQNVSCKERQFLLFPRSSPGCSWLEQGQKILVMKVSWKMSTEPGHFCRGFWIPRCLSEAFMSTAGIDVCLILTQVEQTFILGRQDPFVTGCNCLWAGSELKFLIIFLSWWEKFY